MRGPVDAVRKVSLDIKDGEFFVILPETSKKGASTKAERLRMFVSSKDYHGVSLSIGLATYPDDGVDAVSLLKRADQALRQAVQKGKNQVKEA